jgi:uncharacterized Fe-S radical SAM superfamily protein PflX
MGLDPVIARAAPHFWGEPCISGTVFFTGCVLRCAYCQNGEKIISDNRKLWGKMNCIVY